MHFLIKRKSQKQGEGANEKNEVAVSQMRFRSTERTTSHMYLHAETAEIVTKSDPKPSRPCRQLGSLRKDMDGAKKNGEKLDVLTYSEYPLVC